MELRRLLRILDRHKRSIAILALSATVNAVLITYVVTAKYDSEALILIRPQQAVKFTPSSLDKELLNFPITFGTPFTTTSRTYSEVIRSRTIAEKVVRLLSLQDAEINKGLWDSVKSTVKGVFRDGWAVLKYGTVKDSDPIEAATLRVQAALAVVPTKDTFVFEIRCRFVDPGLAAAIANAAAEEFVEYSREANRLEARGAREFLETQLRDSELELDEARRALREFKENRRTTQIEEEISARIEALAQFETSYEENEEAIRAIEAEITDYRAQLETQGQYLTSSSTVRDNPLVSELRSELARLEVDRTGLLETRTPAHPEVVEVEARIAGIEALLGQEGARVLSEETSSLNENYVYLQQKLLVAETTLASLSASREALESVIDRREAALQAFPELQSQFGHLRLARDEAEATYRLIRREYDEARVREAEMLSEIRVVAPAIAPTYPTSPIKVYYAGVSFAMALLIGVAFALVFDFVTARVSSVDEAEAALGIPVLATIPSVQSSEEPPASPAEA